MATTIPAMRAVFGSTEYFLTTMKAGELIDKLKIPKELEDWQEMTLEERFQRDINYKRVKDHIAPYLALDKDRFFGALIVDIYNADGLEYESMGEVLKDVPKSYKHASTGFGYLHMTGAEILVPLDGQHRLAAFRFAITGKDEKSAEIKGMPANKEVANDDVTLIMIRHDEKKVRKIFNKVNRYAKPTTKAENLITADDDIIAVITREIANELIEERLINYESNTLSKKAQYFTTLATLYDCNQAILENTHGKIDITRLPDVAKQKLYRDELRTTWNSLLNDVELFSLALADKSDAGDEKRVEIRDSYLLGKPLAQYALVSAYIRLKDEPTRLKHKEIVERVNKIDWKYDNAMWQKVLLDAERIVAGRQAMLFASRFIAYLLGEKLTEVEIKALESNYKSRFPVPDQPRIKLPKPLYK